jgi:quercetin dioxygenase-like cupin family protein
MDRLVLAASIVFVTGSCASDKLPAATSSIGSDRTELLRADLSVGDREVRQVRVELAPHSQSPRHSHPGEEVIYILEGTVEYRVGDAPPKQYAKGEALIVPADTIHSARNVGSEIAAELATYIVAKDRPLIRLAE